MNKNYTIHKAAGVIIRDRKVLTTRSVGKNIFINPGGKLEAGETEHEALVRELHEELQIDAKPEDFEYIGTFYSQAAYSPDDVVRLDAYLVKKWEGDIIPSAEVAEARWITSKVPEDIELATIFEHDVLPLLKKKHLIT